MPSVCTYWSQRCCRDCVIKNGWVLITVQSVQDGPTEESLGVRTWITSAVQFEVNGAQLMVVVDCNVQPGQAAPLPVQPLKRSKQLELLLSDLQAHTGLPGYQLTQIHICICNWLCICFSISTFSLLVFRNSCTADLQALLKGDQLSRRPRFILVGLDS